VAKKKRGVSSRKKQQILPGHRREKRKMVPPLLQVGPIKEVVWYDQLLPDFLWLAMMMGRRSDWSAVYSALDVVDQFVPDGKWFVDGRLTTFALVPEERRAEVRTALRADAPHSLPAVFGHALYLLPSCPARWLYDDWFERTPHDEGAGLETLRSLISDHTDKAGVRETRLRMAAFARRVKHGKFSYSPNPTFELFPKYPGGLTKSEQGQVESVVRASWMSIFGMEVDENPEVLTWPREFWQRCRDLTECRYPESKERKEAVVMGEDREELDPEPFMQVGEMREILVAMDALGEVLRETQREALDDPAGDEIRAVMLGLASRMYRSLYSFVERPSAWVSDTAGLHLRPLVDTRILIGWLVKRDDPKVFAAYREHGLGRLKLLREHVKADLGDDPDEVVQEMLERLDHRVNLERDEMYQPVNLGSYADVSPRDMAIEADLKREYDLAYAPLSSANHGEWPAVRETDTVLCREPLHRNHRIGAFQGTGREIAVDPPFHALDLSRKGIAEVFDYLGHSVEASFEPVEAALNAAIFEPSDN
jgi:hypothetical protein